MKMKGLHCPRLAGNSARGRSLGAPARERHSGFVCEPEITELKIRNKQKVIIVGRCKIAPHLVIRKP